jgi:hypothetical protein
LHRSLSELSEHAFARLAAFGAARPALDCLRDAVARTGARCGVLESTLRASGRRTRSRSEEELRADGLVAESFNGALLHETVGDPERQRALRIASYTPFKRRVSENARSTCADSCSSAVDRASHLAEGRDAR